MHGSIKYGLFLSKMSDRAVQPILSQIEVIENLDMSFYKTIKRNPIIDVHTVPGILKDATLNLTLWRNP